MYRQCLTARPILLTQDESFASACWSKFTAAPRTAPKIIFAVLVVAVIVLYVLLIVASVTVNDGYASLNKQFTAFEYEGSGSTLGADAITFTVTFTRLDATTSSSAIAALLHWTYPASMLAGVAPKKLASSTTWLLNDAETIVQHPTGSFAPDVTQIFAVDSGT